MKNLSVIFFLISLVSYSQELLKEYNKEIALYQTKFFIAEELIGEEQDYQKFIIDPLAAAKSTELTSVFYEIISSGQKGLILGFYDNYWVSSGPTYQGFSFKKLGYEDALELLAKIEKIIDEEKKFLNADDDENNIYFTYKDMAVIIYRSNLLAGRIRIYWNNFDAEWENTSFRRTKRRFEKAVKK